LRLVIELGGENYNEPQKLLTTWGFFSFYIFFYAALFFINFFFVDSTMKSLRPRPDLTTIQGHKYQTKCDLATATIESDFGFLISDGLLIRREGLTMQLERFPKIYALCKSSSDKGAFIHSQGITTFVSCNPVH